MHKNISGDESIHIKSIFMSKFVLLRVSKLFDLINTFKPEFLKIYFCMYMQRGFELEEVGGEAVS